MWDIVGDPKLEAGLNNEFLTIMLVHSGGSDSFFRALDEKRLKNMDRTTQTQNFV